MALKFKQAGLGLLVALFTSIAGAQEPTNFVERFLYRLFGDTKIEDTKALGLIEAKLLGIKGASVDLVNPIELPLLLYGRAILHSNLILDSDQNLDPIVKTLSAVNDYYAQEKRWHWEFPEYNSLGLPDWNQFRSDVALVKKFALQKLEEKYQWRAKDLMQKNKPNAAKYYEDLIAEIRSQEIDRAVFTETKLNDDGTSSFKKIFTEPFKPGYFASAISNQVFVFCYYVKQYSSDASPSNRELYQEKIEQLKIYFRDLNGYPHQDLVESLINR